MTDDRRDPDAPGAPGAGDSAAHGADELAGFEDVAPDDPRAASLGPRARAGLRAHRDFLAPGDTPEGARVAEAEARLGQALERELGVTLDTARPTAIAPGGARHAGGFLEALLGPRLRPAFAVALVVIVAGGAWLYVAGRRAGEEPVMRGGAPAAPGAGLTATVRTLGDGIRLEWTAQEGAESYALTFLSPDLVEVARIDDVRETHVDLAAGSLPAGLASGSSVLWRVSAMRGGDELARSSTTTVTVP